MNGAHSVPTRRRWMVSVFGDITRNGPWHPDEKLSPVAVFGDVTLDFRHSDVGGRDVTITAFVPFGDLQVLVPEGVHAELGGLTVFGSKRTEGVKVAGASAPRLRIRVYSIFGSSSVWSP